MTPRASPDDIVSATRYRLKSYVYFGETAAGIWFEAGKKSFVLRDRKLYPIVERFIAMIDGGMPVEEIERRTPERVRPLFPRLLNSLMEHDMLQPLPAGYAAPAARTDPAPDEQLLKVLEDRLGGDDLAAAVARWQAAHVVVVGNGYAAKAAAGALAASGARRLTLLCTAGAEIEADEVAAAVAAQKMPGAKMHVEVAVPPLDPASLTTADLLVYVADATDTQAARTCAAAATHRGITGIVAGVFAGRAVCSPPIEDGHVGLGALLHWLPHADEEDPSHSPASLSMLGCVAAQSALFAFFGFDVDARRGMVSIVTPWLEVKAHALVAAPAHLVSAPFVHAARHEAPHARSLEAFETIKLALDPWFDPVLGPLQIADDTAIRQMPLLQYPVTVRRPHDPRGDALAIGWGLDLGEAGLRAIREGIGIMAAPLVPAGASFAVGHDDAAWIGAATVDALVGSPLFAARQRAAVIAVDQVDDGVVRVLRRLIRYHRDAPLEAELRWSDLGPAYVVLLRIGGNLVATAAGNRIEAALAEALGRACSDFQLASVASDHWAGRSLALPPARIEADWHDALNVPADFRDTALVVRPLTSLGLPPALVGGTVAVRS